MWYLNFIPDAWLHLVIHGILILGIVLSVIGTISKYIPFINTYGTIIRIIGTVMVIAGVYFEGGYGVEMSWREKTNEMQAKIDTAEKKSDELKDQLKNASEQKTVIIKEKVTQNAKDIETKREVINTGCTVNDDAWLLYNRAVAPKLPISAGQPASSR
jgi:hypothetical protein